MRMDSELKQHIQSLEKKVDDLSVIVRRIRRSQRNAAIIRATYWVFIILFAVGALWFIKPYVEQLGVVYNATIGSTSDMKHINNLLNQVGDFKKGLTY